MAVQVFPAGAWSFDFGSQQEESFAVLESVFGDGYIQRTADGLNSNRDTWAAKWSNLSDSEMSLIWDFLRARGGYDPFYFKAPQDVEYKQWTARDLKRQPTGYGYWTISATFKEEFGAEVEIVYSFFIRGAVGMGSAGIIRGNAPTKVLTGAYATGFAGIIFPSKAHLTGVAGTGSAGTVTVTIT